MKKSTAILFSLLLVLSSQVSADRPGLEDRSSMADEIDVAPAAPVQKTIVQQEMGDVLEISQGETIDIKPLDFPKRGMTMDKVLNELGQPKQAPPAVGKPAITKWVYDDRTVYFENKTVIHVVANH